VQSEQSSSGQQNWIERFWPTIRLGVLTSIFGFASLLLSGFPGLAQLGLYAIAGLISAATMTRFVLPHLLPTTFRIHDVSAVGLVLSRLVQRAIALRWLTVTLLLAASVIILQHRTSLWNDKLSSLSPVSQAEVALDTSLRADMGAPDVRYLVVVSGESQESVLQSSEQVSVALQTQVDQGELTRFESPSHYLPSAATQRARQASLPSADILKIRLTQAIQDLPVRTQLFTPFLADIATTRNQTLLQAADLEQTSMAMAIDALLTHQGHHWSALLPLTAPEGVSINASKIRAALSATGLPNVLFVDMKAESDRLYSGYLHEVIQLSLGGLLALIGLLLFALRSPIRVARIIAPLAASVITVTAGLILFGQQLIILHLVGFLLVVAIGSNYALFFDRADHTRLSGQGTMPESEKDARTIYSRTLASMLFANLTTVAGFGLLSFSNVSILQAIGVTVAPGVILALIYSAIFAKQPHA
jgi:predicted exporter